MLESSNVFPSMTNLPVAFQLTPVLYGMPQVRFLWYGLRSSFLLPFFSAGWRGDYSRFVHLKKYSEYWSKPEHFETFSRT